MGGGRQGCIAFGASRVENPPGHKSVWNDGLLDLSDRFRAINLSGFGVQVGFTCGSNNLQFSSKYPLISRYNP